MSANKLCAPTKGNTGNCYISSARSNAVPSYNPYDVLSTVVEAWSDGSGSSSSPTWSGGSVSQNGGGSSAAIGTPSRGFVSSGFQAAQQHRKMNCYSPQDVRSMSYTGNTSAAFASPGGNRMPPAGDYGFDSPHKVATPCRFTVNTEHFGSPQGLPQGQRRDSASARASPSSRRGSGRASFGSSLRTPTILQDPNASSLTGVPEMCTVQEMAFRRGQHDHSVTRDRSPSSPFAKQYDQVWAEFYLLGKTCGGTPGASSTATAPSSHHNFPWTVLINPYTQDLERPNGAIDPEWVWKICDMALNCMQALVETVCRRQGEWRKTICDVPVQVQHAMMTFPDLRMRYDQLKQDAREAIAGGLPIGY